MRDKPSCPLAAALLTAALVGATWPAWRVLLLGERATLEELLMLVCSTTKPPPAGGISAGPARPRR